MQGENDNQMDNSGYLSLCLQLHEKWDLGVSFHSPINEQHEPNQEQHEQPFH